MPPPARLHSGVHRVLPRCREASVGLTCAFGSVRGPVQACTHICSSAMHSPRTRPSFSLPPPSPPSPTFLPDDPPRLSCDNTASVTSLWGYMQHHLFFFAIIHALVVDVPSGCFLTATIVATERLVSFSHCLSTAPRSGTLYGRMLLAGLGFGCPAPFLLLGACLSTGAGCQGIAACTAFIICSFF